MVYLSDPFGGWVQDRVDELRSREKILDDVVRAKGIEEALGDTAKGKDPYLVRLQSRKSFPSHG